MSLLDKIKSCTAVPGISGREAGIVDWICNELKEAGIEATLDERGNVHAEINNGRKKGKTVLLEAHMDSIGLMVSNIEKNGLLSFLTVGGVDERILFGLEVALLTEPILDGVVQCIHPDKEKKTVEDFRIDIGMDEKTAKQKVKIGYIAQIKGPFRMLGEHCLAATSLDNRAGVCALLHVAKTLKKQDCPYEIKLLFATSEEVGMQGAKTGCEKADLAFVVDVTYGMCPQSKDMTGVFPLGSGVAIGRGPSLDERYTQKAIQLAKEKQIPYTIEPLAGNSGTDAWAIQASHGGIPCVLFSIPLRYMHTPIEVVKEEDVAALCQLIEACLLGGDFFAE